jgi:uncharacterized linocin/CFP29 family protein
MNNLHRELAPMSEAWEQIEEEASRTFKRYLVVRCCSAQHPSAGH